MQKFNNENRHRHYGLRVGDIVTSSAYSWKENIFMGEVVDYGFLDNNAVMVLTPDGEVSKYVAEWLDIVVKVEDRDDFVEIEEV